MSEDIDVGGAVGADIGVRNPRAAATRGSSMMIIHGTNTADTACLLVGRTVLQSWPQPTHMLMLRLRMALNVAGSGMQRATSSIHLRTRMKADFSIGAGVLVGRLQSSVEV